ncbi:hypothetical protein SMICM17S_07834 [Streptomyces microflavus]
MTSAPGVSVCAKAVIRPTPSAMPPRAATFQNVRGMKSSQPLPWGHFAYTTPWDASKVAVPSAFSRR